MKSLIDMSRSNTLYLSGLGVLMMTSLLINTLPLLAPSTYIAIAHQQYLMAVALAVGALFGLLSLNRHLARANAPWKVPQSQVSVCFSTFFAFTLVGILISR